MGGLRRINVKTRLSLVSIFLIIVVGGLTVLELFMTNNLSTVQQDTTQNITRKLEYATTMSNSFKALLMHLNSVEDSNENIQAINQLFSGYSNSFNEYRRLALASEYNILSSSFFDSLSSNFGEFQQLYVSFVQGEIDVNSTGQLRLIQLGNGIASDISRIIEASNNNLVLANQAFSEDFIFLSRLQNIIYAISIITVIIFLSMISGSIVKPMEDLEGSINSIINGDTKISIDMNSNDEVGKLSKSVAGIIFQFKEFANDMGSMSDKIIKQNNTKIRLNKNSYKGEFVSIASAYNETIEKLISEHKMVDDAINNLSKGEFGLGFERQLHTDTYANESLQKLKSDLRNASKEIKNLIELAISGKFDEQTNANNYSGIWREIILDLNTLLNDNKKRVNGIVLALAEIERGNQSINVSGSFEGEYKEIKNSIERTNGAVSVRINEISKSSDSTTMANTMQTTAFPSRATSTFSRTSSTTNRKPAISKKELDANSEMSFLERKESVRNEPYIDFSQRGFGKY